MSELSKQALKVENTESFPNNSAGLITPSALRTFNEDMIDSLVDEITYNEDSASWNQSIDALEQFTASQQPSFTALNEFTASQLVVNSGVNSFTQSADGRLDTLETEVDSLQAWTGSVNEISDDGIVQGYSTRLHFYGNVSASIVQNVGGPIASINIPLSDVDTGSLLTTASFDEGTRNLTFTKGDASQFSVYIADVSGSVLPSGVVSGSSQIILQDTTGQLSGSRIDGEVANAVSASYAVTASYALNSQTIDTGSFATTGSNTFIGDQTIQNGNDKTIITDQQVYFQNAFNPVETRMTKNGLLLNDNTGVSALVLSSAPYNLFSLGISDYNGPLRGLFYNTGSNTSTPTLPILGVINGNNFDDKAYLMLDTVVSGTLDVEDTVTSQIFINPQTLTGTLTIPTDRNAMVVGTVAIDGSLVIEGDSKLIVIDQVSGSGGTTIETGSFATTGSNIFYGDQTITGSLYASTSYAEPHILKGPLYVQAGTDILQGSVFSGNLEILNGAFTLNQSSTPYINQFNFANDGRLDISWPNGSIYRMQNGAFLFGGNSGFGMVFDSAGIDFRNISGESQKIALSNSINNFGSLNQTPYTGSLRGLFYNQTGNFDSPTLPVIGVNESSSFDNTAYIEMNLNVSGSTTIGQAMSLTPQDPLPSGNIGDLAVSGSSLYFYNGAWTLVV